MRSATLIRNQPSLYGSRAVGINECGYAYICVWTSRQIPMSTREPRQNKSKSQKASIPKIDCGRQDHCSKLSKTNNSPCMITSLIAEMTNDNARVSVASV